MVKKKKKDSDIKQLLFSLVGESPVGIILINITGEIILMNHISLKALQLNENLSHYINKELLSILNTSEVTETISKCLTKGRFNFDFNSVKYGKSYINFKGRTILQGMLITLEDVTSLVIANEKLIAQKKELEIKNKGLEEFAYITSHDLQEPLINIIGFNNLIQKRIKEVPVPEEIIKYLNIINNATIRASHQIKGLLDLSRINGDKERETVDCNEIVKNVLSSFATQISDVKAKVIVNDLPTFSALKTELISLFQVLISNSIKFRRKDTQLIIEIDSFKEGDFYHFTVKDNGIGIDEAQHKNIFRIFRKLHNRNNYEGYGIGLAHAKKIVQVHDGDIYFSSNPQKGVTFHIKIK